MFICLGSGWSCSYSSVGSPGGGCCTVCSHLALEEVSIAYSDCLSSKISGGTKAEKQDKLYITQVQPPDMIQPEHLLHYYMYMCGSLLDCSSFLSLSVGLYLG